jgi:hypothetical protein
MSKNTITLLIYHRHKTLDLTIVISFIRIQLNTAHNFTLYFSKAKFHITFQYTPTSLKWSLPACMFVFFLA